MSVNAKDYNVKTIKILAYRHSSGSCRSCCSSRSLCTLWNKNKGGDDVIAKTFMKGVWGTIYCQVNIISINHLRVSELFQLFPFVKLRYLIDFTVPSEYYNNSRQAPDVLLCTCVLSYICSISGYYITLECCFTYVGDHTHRLSSVSLFAGGTNWTRSTRSAWSPGRPNRTSVTTITLQHRETHQWCLKDVHGML